MPPRYREIEACGSPLEMGRQIGEATRNEIRGFAAVALERVHKTVRISREKASKIAAECSTYVEQYAPDLLVELRGMSESSGVSFSDLMLLQVRNQFTPETDSGCTSFSMGRAVCREGRMFVGQNWDNDPALDPFTVVLTRRPTNQPAMMTVTQAGLIAYIGLNDAGMAACLNMLPAPSRAVGVPLYFILRTIYETRTLDDAVESVRRAERAIPSNIMLATRQGPADLEVTLDNVHILRDDGEGVVTHTNHCLHPDLVHINEQFDEVIQSKPRKRRIDEILDVASGLFDLAQLKTALSDHQDYPTSICRHANDHPQYGFWKTVFSVIIDPENCQMHIARGTPCNHPYEIYRMD